MHIYLFDIDGTLISSGGAGKHALEQALAAEYGIERGMEQVDFRGRTDRAIILQLFELFDIEPTPANWQRLLNAYLVQLPTSLQTRPGRVLPGIGALLERLRGREDVLLGLLTGNVHAGARVKLGHFGLFEHFRCGGFGDRHLDRDEVAREAFDVVCTHLGCHVDPARIWVIGDTPLDVRCARSIGARAVAVATGWHSREELAAARPDVLLTDLSDPALLLTELLD